MSLLHEILKHATKALWLVVSIAFLIWFSIVILPVVGIRLPDLEKALGNNDQDISTSTKKTYILDILPAPGTFQIMNSSATAFRPTAYVHPDSQIAYRNTEAGARGSTIQSYGTSIQYGTSTIVEVIKTQTAKPSIYQYGKISNLPFTELLRNLNIYDGSSIKAGASVYGEINIAMLEGGRTFLAIAEQETGKIQSEALVTSIEGLASNGFTRFKAVIPNTPSFPAGKKCILIITSAPNSTLSVTDIQIHIPVSCK